MENCYILYPYSVSSELSWYLKGINSQAESASLIMIFSEMTDRQTQQTIYWNLD